MFDKKILRKEILILRKNMTKEEVELKSKKICERILLSKITDSFDDVLVYYPVNNEVDLRYLFSDLIKENKNIWLPVVNGKNMSFHLYENEERLNIGECGIPEPLSPIIYERKDKMSLMIMPGVAFSENRDRLGYGGGYYDRFLDSNDCYTAAVAFDTQIVKCIPNESHDKKPNIIITDKRTIG